jgi:hypothetical protein
MRKEELHHVLMHPEQLSDEQLVELRETVARFPFFGAAQIALTRAYKARGDMRFTDQLSQAAIYTGHRAALYHRLKSIHAGTQTTSVQPVEETPVQEEQSLAARIVEHEQVPTTIEPMPEESIAFQPFEPLITELPVAEEPEEAPQITVEETMVLRINELDTLEAQFLVNAVHTSIEMEVQPEHHQEPEGESTQANLEPEDENSYAALIYRRAQRKHQLPSDSDLPPSEESDETVESLPAFQSTPLSHGIQRIRSTDARTNQRDLVDRFIQLEPQIARGKAGDYPTGNMAKDSLEDDFSMVTETMAVLFAKQGKLDKARKAFRKLMEQHPEKSIYFAAQLKNLEHFKK